MAFKSMYKMYHRIMKRREIATSQNGDLTGDVSTQFSTYIKTLANKKNFQH